MLSADAAHKLHVYVRNSKGEPKRFGRVHAMVFHPTQLKAIGYAIKRPDALLMVKRKDRFAALDRIEPVEGGIAVVDAADSWDEQACKRLGVDYDKCVIWEHMPVRTRSGRELGTISDVAVSEDDFSIQSIDISLGAADRMLLGSSLIDASRIVGYQDGAIVVQDFEGDVEEEGGAAAKAGEAWAKTKQAATQGAKKAGAKLEEGTLKGANLLGQQIGRTKGMFKSFKEEFDKASRGDE